MAYRWPPACLPVGAMIVGVALAPRLTIAPAASLLVALSVLGVALGHPAGLAIALGALGLLRAEAAWVAPLRASPGWDLARPVEALFVPDAGWEARDESWSARGRIVALTQDGRTEALDLAARAVVPAQSPAEGASRTPVAAASAYRMRGYLRSPMAFYDGEPPIWTGSWQLRVKSRRFMTPVGERAMRSLPSLARDRLTSGLGPAGDRGPGAGLLEGLLLGRASALPEDWQRGLRRTGLAHLFAVSGLHVSLVAGVAWMVTAPFRTPLRGAAALVAAVAYSLLVGLGPTVLRATLMLAAMIGARLSKRAPSTLNALALAAGGLVAASPSLVESLSFRLTVAATAGIVALGPWLASRWGRGPLVMPLAACAGAQLATLPFTLPAFSILPLGGAIMNLVAVPWTGLCLVLGLLWAVVALVEPGWGTALLPWFDPLARPFGWLAAPPPHSLISAPLALGPGAAAALAVVVLGLAARPRWLLLAAPLAAVLVASSRPRDFEVTLLDVGQGDAILLRDGSGSILVDGGGWPGGDFGGRVLLPALARLGVRSLDAVVVSHPDTDHCAGLADLASYLPIAELWIAPGWRGAPCLLRLLAGPVRRVRVLWRGDRLKWRRFDLAVLHPPPGEVGAGNDRSLVIEAAAGGRSFLLTGDIPERVETLLVRRRVLEPVDVLKVAHHGSRSSTSLPFLASTVPRWALVSAGRSNAYGHPSAVALERLARRRITVLRTDLHGRVRLRWCPGGPLRIDTGRTPVSGLPRPVRSRPGMERL